MTDKQKKSNILLSLGMLILLAMAIMPLVGIMYPWIKYVYAFGAVLTLIARIIDKYTGKNLTLRRLYRIQMVSSVLYCASAAVLCISMGDYVSEKDWLAFLTAGAVMQIYSSFRIQKEEQKEAKDNKN